MTTACTRCNNQAVVGLKTFDRLHGTHHWRDLEAIYRGNLEREFRDVDGHRVLLRSTRAGFTIPGLSTAREDAICAFWMHPVFPDLARRLWAVARAELFTTPAGQLSLKPLKPWLDPGNYRFNTADYLGALGMAARELGDEEAVAAIQSHVDQLDRREANGVLSYPGCSTWTHAFLLKMRLGRANAMADLVNLGMPASWRDGPVIAGARYPEVLVAQAVSDGAALQAVVYSGGAPGPITLTLGQLRPKLRYRCSGAEENSVVADDDGRMSLTLNLEGRHELRVSPIL